MYKINALTQLQRHIFHTSDLGVLWKISNRNTLYTTIKRFVSRGTLIPIHKGFYATLPLDRISPVELGTGFLHSYAYLSTETILFRNGVISQPPHSVTLVSSYSKKFAVGNTNYLSRRLKPLFLYSSSGIKEKDGFFEASPERSAADLLYFSPHYHFDNPSLFDRQKVDDVRREIGYI